MLVGARSLLAVFLSIHVGGAAIIHVVADAAVSFLVIVGLALARLFGWLWMDPLAGIVGACVIASWSCGPIRDTGAILLDMTPTGR
jgi:Co/Zn/Cd efflux system component